MSRAVRDRILLVGMMAVGKTTVGRALQDRLGWPYVDNDELVRRAAGMALEELHVAQGEQGLRAAENAAVTHALADPGPLVAAIAGGALLDETNRARVAHGGMVVWLRATPQTLAARIGDNAAKRPWVDPGDVVGSLRRLAADRDPGYRAAADLAVDVDHLDGPATAGQIIDGLGLTEVAR